MRSEYFVSVTAIAEGPVKGWVTNLYGLNGLLLAGGVGLLRVAKANDSAKAQIVCSDQVVNATMVVLWEIGSKNEYANKFDCV